MTFIQSIFLGLLQGIAEFLPISSSGHLAVVQNIFGLEDIPLLYDVFLHLATLLAVCIYFRKSIWTLLKVFGRMIARKPAPAETDENDILCGTEERGRKTILALIISTIITGAIGVGTSKLIPNLSIKITCAGFLVTSCLLIISSFIEKKSAAKAENTPKAEAKGISVFQAAMIGFMQGVGTLPGISRSGSTIAGAQLCGVERSAAGEYSFLVSIFAILGAFVLELKDLGEVSSSIGAGVVAAGCVAAFVSGYFALACLMKIIKKGKLEWFAAYLIPAGILGMIFLK